MFVLIRRCPRASIDNIRLWNVAEVGEFDKKVKSGVQFKIIAGHHGGFISQMRAYDFGSPLNPFLTSAPSR
jgi:transcriptional activator SPT8